MERTQRGYDLYDDLEVRSDQGHVCAEARSDVGGLMGVRADLVGGQNIKVMAEGHGRVLCVQAWVCAGVQII